MGKTSVDAMPINVALSRVRNPDRTPVLGFPIHTAWKGAGSVEDGVNELNRGFASGALKIDSSNKAAIEAVSMWGDGEAYKDVCDAGRYIIREILISNLGTRGKSGLKIV